MLKPILPIFACSILSLLASSSNSSATPPKQNNSSKQIETIEKLVITGGSATIDLDLNLSSDTGSSKDETTRETVRFGLVPDSFFTILVSNDLLRGPLPGEVGLISQNAADLPPPLSASLHQLIVAKTQGTTFDLVLRDKKSGFVFFNLVGHHYDYDAETHSFTINDASLLISDEFARQFGHSSTSQKVAGTLFVRASTSPIEVRTFANGELQSATLPPLRGHVAMGAQSQSEVATAVPGPDVIVGEILSVEQAAGGINGGFVGLGVGTTSCNNGDQEINWLGLPNNDHPVIPQNLYRMSGGANFNDRFEQIGQSWLKHSFFATQDDACGFGCVAHPSPTPAGDGHHLGVGCSDPYSANLNYSQPGLGSRAWVNPFTGFYPWGDSTTPPNNHTGHVHNGTSHRVTVAISDLNTTLNANASYFGEAQYVTPHEYAWCQAHPGQCNMYNNVSYRPFSVFSSDQMSFTFFPNLGPTIQMQPAIMAWTGAAINQVEPAPGADGVAFVGYKVTNPSAGVWHYEYAIYNENLDRGIQSFSVPLGLGANVSNIGFHSPPQEPGFPNDGTVGNTGFSIAPWTPTQTSTSLSWNSETFAQNQNANAIRWGTLYNFRFDANSPPQAVNATVGFFKTGSPVIVAIQAPSAPITPTPTPGSINVSGTVSYCSNPSLAPVPAVTVTVAGGAGGSTVTDANGNYTLNVPSGGNYTVTPSKAPLTPGVAGINTIDVIAVQRHFLLIGTPLSGCRLTAADVNGLNGVDTVDVVAIQRFFLTMSTGIANVGKYQFNPANRNYSGVISDQTGQNYDALIFGDVTGSFVY